MLITLLSLIGILIVAYVLIVKFYPSFGGDVTKKDYQSYTSSKQNILIDPMFGKVAAPMNFLGENRFNKEIPLEIEKLPKIDAVVISHDHYDHLDYESIEKLKSKVEHYFVH